MSNEKLLDALNQAVIDKTLSLEGLQALDALKKNLVSLEAENKTLKDQRDAARATGDEYKKQLQESLATNQTISAENLRLKSNEDKVTQALFEARFSELRRQDCFEMLRTIFRSPVMAKVTQVSESVPVVRSYGNGGGDHVETHTKSTTTTEKVGENDPTKGGF